MTKLKKSLRKKELKSLTKWSIPLRKTNFLIFGIGLILLFIGFYIMTIPPWNSIYALIISPIILLVGYFVVFPIGILKKGRSTK